MTHFYIPEWDDLVTKDYDYWNEADGSDERLYAHEIYPRPNYDGILVSRMKLEQSQRKVEELRQVGLQRYLRFDGPVLGDSGAWGYVNDPDPPYNVKEMVKFYSEVGVTYGVSVDHLILPGNKDEWEHRYELTLANGRTFLAECHRQGDPFIPIGAAQGWDPPSYADSVEELLDMGYTYIGVGGIARAQTQQVMAILKALQPVLGRRREDVEMHLFGVARLDAIRDFVRLGVTSFDSASPLRSAWLGRKKNYRDNQWRGYTAVRIPQLTRSARYYKRYPLPELEVWEEALKQIIREHEFEQTWTPEEVAETLHQLDVWLGDGEAPDIREEVGQTLRDRPWEKCGCVICNDVGLEVLVFRGNNRNRRRGFHNTYVFYQLLQRILTDPSFDVKDLEGEEDEENGGGGKRTVQPKRKTRKLYDFM